MSGKDLLSAATTFDDRVVGRLGRWIVSIVRRIDPKYRFIALLPKVLAWHIKISLNVWAARTEVHHGQSMQPLDVPHVLLVSHELSATGAPRVVFEIADILISHGLGVAVLSAKDGPFREPLVELGAVVVINAAAMMPYSSIAECLAAQADVAICNTVVTAHVVRRVSGALPTFWYLHEVSMLAEDLVEHRKLAGTFALPNAVWAGSEICASLIRPHRDSVRVLAYGLNPLPSSLKQLPGAHEGPLRIAVFGSFEKRKGQDLAVAAVQRLASRERDAVKLSLYGQVLQSDFYASVEALVAQTPEAHLCGALDAKAYEAAVPGVDAVLVSSRDDTLPLVSLDALGAGRVLLCTPTTGTSAYLQPGVDGFVSAGADAESIANMLSSAIARRAEWPEIGKAGEALFNRAFSKTAFSQCILDAIEPFLGEAMTRL
jgi:glycosyltransferase involved in cell wall biosynthesis